MVSSALSQGSRFTVQGAILSLGSPFFQSRSRGILNPLHIVHRCPADPCLGQSIMLERAAFQLSGSPFHLAEHNRNPKITPTHK